MLVGYAAGMGSWKHLAAWVGAAACSCSSGGLGPVTDPAAHADPRMGSGGYGYAYGAAWPGASMRTRG